MKNSNIEKPILGKKKNLSYSENIILNFINSYDQEIFNLSSKELANKCFCSEATISRFVKKYGFNSYREFLIYVNSQFYDFYHDTNFLNQEKNDSFKIIFETQNFAFQNTVDYMNFELIQKIAKLIHKSKKIFLLGLGTSNKVINEFASNLQKIGINVISDYDFHVLFPLIPTLNKDDIAFFISNNLENQEIIFAINEIYKRGAKIVLLTSHSGNFLEDKIAIKFIFKKIHDPQKVVPLGSRLSSFIIIDYLFHIILDMDPEYKMLLKETDKIIEKWRRFIK
ncbi:MurR/RpiR family transcriptional regulator [Candidatus Mycoplasma pogonae]